MSWRFKNKIKEDDEDEDYINQEEQVEEGGQNLDGDEDDPLDAFMQDLDKKASFAIPVFRQKAENKDNEENEGDNQNELDYQFFEVDREQILEDQISNQYEPKKQENRKIIEGLKPFDFSQVLLQQFQKNFYAEHQQILNMPTDLYNKIMKQQEIKVTGTNVPKPIVSFGHLPLTQKIKKVISQQQFQHPTPIQAQALPCAFAGRDIVGIAKTGSGKTLAYVWPLIIHVYNKRQSKRGQGPSALVLAPTRELCQQIYIQIKKYVKKQQLKIDCLLGGQNKHDQWKTLKAGTDIIIASPGRLIELLRKKATNLLRVTYIVLDEADRMLSLGFEQQIRSIVSQTREDRQTLLFTATMKKNMQILVGDIVTDPIRITIGDQGAANENVKQQVVIVKQQQQKVSWVERKIKELVAQGKVLIFVNHKAECENIGSFISNLLKKQVLVLHGDKLQYERTSIMNSFKGQSEVLVATQIAARGIDVKNIKTVINYQCPKTIQAYIHRIGRAGRAGEVGTSYTFLTRADLKLAIQLVSTFENSGYPVPEQLEELTMLDDGFRRKRISAKMGVSFAKGKDATKYLNHALKRQRKGYSRAGLGYQQGKKERSSGYLNLNEESQKLKSGDIQEISTMIRNKMSDIKFENKNGKTFIKSQSNEMNSLISEPTITYFKKKDK